MDQNYWQGIKINKVILCFKFQAHFMFWPLALSTWWGNVCFLSSSLLQDKGSRGNQCSLPACLANRAGKWASRAADRDIVNTELDELWMRSESEQSRDLFLSFWNSWKVSLEWLRLSIRMEQHFGVRAALFSSLREDHKRTWVHLNQWVRSKIGLKVKAAPFNIVD